MGESFRRPPGDPRVAQTRDIVLNAARELLVREGQDAVSPTRLSEMTGVSRSTIYRHWDDPSEIIYEALGTDRRDGEFELSGDLRADLIRYLEALRIGLDTPQGKLIATQVDRAEHSEKAAERLYGVSEGRRDSLARAAQAARGDRFAIAHALLVGPIFFQRYMARGEITDELIEATVDAYLGTLAET